MEGYMHGYKAGYNANCNLDVWLQPRDDEMRVVMQGWLEKCAEQFKTWKWWFFVNELKQLRSMVVYSWSSLFYFRFDGPFGRRHPVRRHTRCICGRGRHCCFCLDCSFCQRHLGRC